MAELTYLAPITYLTKGAGADPDASRFVYGRVSDSSLDIDLQRADPEWLKAALAEWWEWRNIQAGHNGPDVGTGIELTKSADDPHGWDLLAEVVDPLAIAKLDKGVYRAYSIGIRWPKLSFKDASAPGGTIVGGKIVHVALCGRPANSNSRIAVGKSPNVDDFVIAKSAYADVPESVAAIEEAEAIVKAAKPAFPGARCPFCAGPAKGKGEPSDCTCTKDCGADICPAGKGEAEKAASARRAAILAAAEAELHKAPVSTADLNDLPDSAFAYIEPGGEKDSEGKTVPRSKRHFPIMDAAHVRNALARAPQSPFGDKAMPAIRAAAKKFGIEVSDDKAAAAELPETPAGEQTDADLASQAIAIVKQLIAREAAEAAGSDDDDDLDDVSTLTSVLQLLRYFQSGELTEAAMLLTGAGSKAALAELWKTGARNSAADLARIQKIHDHAGDLGAAASDSCRANGSAGDDDMDEKRAKALVDAELESRLPTAVEHYLAAAGVSLDLVKAAVAKPDVVELVKGAVAPLDERLTLIENRAEDHGPLILAVQRGIERGRVSAEKAALAQTVDELRSRAETHQDPRVRAQAAIDYSLARARLEAMKD